MKIRLPFLYTKKPVTATTILAMPNGGYVCQVCYQSWVMQQAALTHKCTGVPVRTPLLFRRVQYRRLDRWLKKR